jgi:uncharacterized DUF497 family protein
VKVTWDPEKEKENIKKHKMGFSYAAEVFMILIVLFGTMMPIALMKTDI